MVGQNTPFRIGAAGKRRLRFCPRESTEPGAVCPPYKWKRLSLRFRVLLHNCWPSAQATSSHLLRPLPAPAVLEITRDRVACSISKRRCFLASLFRGRHRNRAPGADDRGVLSRRGGSAGTLELLWSALVVASISSTSCVRTAATARSQPTISPSVRRLFVDYVPAWLLAGGNRAGPYAFSTRRGVPP